MTVADTGTVDAILRDRTSIELLIVDHLPWDKDERVHLWLLQEKINKYLAYVESGEFLRSYPDDAGIPVSVRIMVQYPVSPSGLDFLTRVRFIIEMAGFALVVETPLDPGAGS